MDRILYLSVMNGSHWGGSEELWYQAALSTAKRGYPTSVCCFDGSGKQRQLRELEKAGCKLYTLPPKEELRKNILGKIRLKQTLRQVPFEKYDKVIVSQGGWKDVAHGPFKKLHRRLNNYILIYHNYNVNEKFPRNKRILLQQWADMALKNLGDTPKIFEALKETYSLNIPRTEKLFNPLTFTPPSQPTPYPAVNNNYILSVFAALDTERKAQDILIKALTADRWKDRNIEVRLYGSGKDKELLQELNTGSGLSHKVILQGNAGDYMEAMRQTHLVLQLTHIDAMPITVMDALAMARPVAVSNVGDMPWWIKEAENGWVAGAVTYEGINEVLEKAWEQRNSWETMGLRSFEIFQTHFPADPIDYFLRQTTIIH